MANHFTPEELAKELGTGTRDVIQLCVREGIPIYKGKIDRSLLTAVMKDQGYPASQDPGGGRPESSSASQTAPTGGERPGRGKDGLALQGLRGAGLGTTTQRDHLTVRPRSR